MISDVLETKRHKTPAVRWQCTIGRTRCQTQQKSPVITFGWNTPCARSSKSWAIVDIPNWLSAPNETKRAACGEHASGIDPRVSWEGYKFYNNIHELINSSIHSQTMIHNKYLLAKVNLPQCQRVSWCYSKYGNTRSLQTKFEQCISVYRLIFIELQTKWTSWVNCECYW